MKEPIFRPLILPFLSIILTLILALSLVFSWFIKEKEISFVLMTGEYDVSMTVSFNDVVVDGTSPYFDTLNKAIIVDSSNYQSSNYIEDLEVSFSIISDNNSRFRIKVQDEWQLKRTYYGVEYVITEALAFEGEETIPGNALYPFVIISPSNYTYDSTTGYLYFNQILEKGQTYNIDFIIGGIPYPIRSTTAYFEECTVYMDFLVDVVQANRAAEVWGIGYDFFE
jgi:hypothetical protein